MGTLKTPEIVMKKSSLTPKAVIFKRFGGKACYKIEEVQEPSQSECPGLAIPQKGPCLYRCHLELPEFSVISETFKRKKDAEQAAAQKAIEKLGIYPKENNPTSQEAWDDIVNRLSYLFSSEFLASVHPPVHPLVGHFRAAFKRDGHLNGCIPVSVIAIHDPKLVNLCKHVNPDVESNPLLAISIILSAAAKLTGSLLPCKDQLSLKRHTPHAPEVLQSLEICENYSPESIQIRALRIPASEELSIGPLVLNASMSGYYLDDVAQELGVPEASRVLISRTIGKASSEMRVYFGAPRIFPLDKSWEQHSIGQTIQFEGSPNVRASYFAGQAVYGDAILASVGYTWKSTDLFHEDLSLQTYYRVLLNKIPSGVYKLSREAVLAAELPVVFTTRSNWRGSFPRDILYTLCRQHHLSEPIFCVHGNSLETSSEIHGSCKKLNGVESVNQGKNKQGPAAAAAVGQSAGPTAAFKCEIKIFSKRQDLILQCFPKKSYKKQLDAIHHTALKILLWLNAFLSNRDMPAEKLRLFAVELEIQFYPEKLFQEFTLCPSMDNCWPGLASLEGRLSYSGHMNGSSDMLENVVSSVCIEGNESGSNPSSGSIVCISYSACLVAEGECMKEPLESHEEFEFELGSGAMVRCFEAIVTQLSVGQSASFNMDLPPREFILAAAADSATTSSLLSLRRCHLEYTITLLRVTEPMEDRMEQALFSPPLSKQRVEYALQHIRETCATSLVDFGCGSGSLLDSLLEYPMSLEKIVGVDISLRSLTRAAKILHSKLNVKADTGVPSNRIKSALLYDGSITVFDSRLYDFDIGTCLEVIEHMEEDEAWQFGDVVLSSFCPRLLIVSTPNYEYNVILQKSSPQSQEEDPDEKNQQQLCKFRNHDHKFEWTRAQFGHWATELATRHNYTVEFSGVGGLADVEPGFASQIAVFRRNDHMFKKGLTHNYGVVWEWSKG